MRFSEEELEVLVDEYLEKAKREYIDEVESIFLNIAANKYVKYKTFNNAVLNELFKGSKFNQFIDDNVDYVMNRYPEYWAKYIINEIDSVVYFKELNAIEIHNVRSLVKTDLQEITIPVNETVSIREMYLRRKFVQVKYVKRKKKFLTAIGLTPVKSNVTIKLFKELLVVLNENYSNQLANSILEKEVTLNKTISNEVIVNDNKWYEEQYEDYNLMAF